MRDYSLARLQPRGLWTPLTDHQEAQDALHWQGAASERGGWLGVLWAELRQLAGDILRR